MTYINLFVLGGYAFFGIVLLVGFLLNLGTLEALAAFSGWFLVIYSIGAYALMAILCFLRASQNFWVTLYPVNLSLALAAISLFGIHDENIISPLLVSAALGFSIGLLTMRSSLAKWRLTPLVTLMPLCFCFFPVVNPYWTLIFSCVAAYLLMNCAVAYVTRRSTS